MAIKYERKSFSSKNDGEIKLKYLMCKYYLSLYQRWWNLLRGPNISELRWKWIDSICHQMNAMFETFSPVQQRFCQMQPDPEI